jgi:hypothetical protein
MTDTIAARLAEIDREAESAADETPYEAHKWSVRHSVYRAHAERLLGETAKLREALGLAIERVHAEEHNYVTCEVGGSVNADRRCPICQLAALRDTAPKGDA